jgi:hypothetical protein
MTTWIEVADTTIKIGLSALISGMVALQLAYRAFRTDLEKERRFKKRQIIEDITEELSEIIDAVVCFNVRARSKIRFSSKEEGVPTKLEEEYDQCYSRVVESSTKYHHIKNRLRLLGYFDLSGDLEGLWEHVISCIKITCPNTEKELDSFNQRVEKFEKSREKYFHALSKEYLKI